MKDKTVGVSIKEFAGFKHKMYSFLVDDSGQHKEAKDANKDFVDTIISHVEYKDIL